MELTSQNVRALMIDCYCLNEEQPGLKQVEGIRNGSFWFYESELVRHQANITAMLMQLPEAFHQTKGGGWSFLNLCQRADGVQWADEHVIMEFLVALGMAVGKIAWLFEDRELWQVMPGGMPYVVVLDK